MRWALGFVVALSAAMAAQQPAATARASAPLDLTGQWVSLVTDDWRWRMVVPPKGDTLYLPVNDAGRKMAAEWDAARDAAAHVYSAEEDEADQEEEAEGDDGWAVGAGDLVDEAEDEGA